MAGGDGGGEGESGGGGALTGGLTASPDAAWEVLEACVRRTLQVLSEWGETVTEAGVALSVMRHRKSGALRVRVGASLTDGEGHGEVSCLRAQSLVAPRAFANCKKDTYGDLLSTQTVRSLSGKTSTSCCVLTQCRNWELEEPSRPRSQPERPATPHHPPDRDGRHRGQPVSRRLSRRLGCTGCVSSSVASRLGFVPQFFVPADSIARIALVGP